MTSSVAKKQTSLRFSNLRLCGDFVGLVLWSGVILLGYFGVIATQTSLAQAVQMAQSRLQAEQTVFSTIKNTLWLDHPATYLTQQENKLKNIGQQWINTDWLQGIQQQLAHLVPEPSSEKHSAVEPFHGVMQNLGRNIAQDAIEVGLLLWLILQILVVKLFELWLAIPLIVCALLLGLSEGLLQRYIRRAEAGRESSYLFHQFAQWGYRALQMYVLGFMVLPSWWTPQAMMLIFVILFTLVIAAVTGRFKKYV